MNYIDNKYSKDSEIVDVSASKLFEQPNLTKENLGMFNFWSESKRKGLSKNATTPVLILDFDSGVSKYKISKKLEDFSWIRYESSSNTIKHNKFRIILLLEKPVTQFTIEQNKENLISFFSGIDEQTFTAGRFFYVPSKFDVEGNKVKIITNLGKKTFDFLKIFPTAQTKWTEEIEKEKIQKNLENKIENLSYINEVPYEKRLEKFCDYVVKKAQDKIENGFHYQEVPQISHPAKRNGIELEDAKKIFSAFYKGHSDWRDWFEKTYKEEDYE